MLYARVRFAYVNCAGKSSSFMQYPSCAEGGSHYVDGYWQLQAHIYLDLSLIRHFFFFNLVQQFVWQLQAFDLWKDVLVSFQYKAACFEHPFMLSAQVFLFDF